MNNEVLAELPGRVHTEKADVERSIKSSVSWKLFNCSFLQRSDTGALFRRFFRHVLWFPSIAEADQSSGRQKSREIPIQ